MIRKLMASLALVGDARPRRRPARHCAGRHRRPLRRPKRSPARARPLAAPGAAACWATSRRCKSAAPRSLAWLEAKASRDRARQTRSGGARRQGDHGHPHAAERAERARPRAPGPHQRALSRRFLGPRETSAELVRRHRRQLAPGERRLDADPCRRAERLMLLASARSRPPRARGPRAVRRTRRRPHRVDPAPRRRASCAARAPAGYVAARTHPR